MFQHKGVLAEKYDKKFKLRATEKVGSIDRNQLLCKKKKKVQQGFNDYNRVFFSTTYSREATQIRRIIYSNWNIIESDSTLREIFREQPMVSYRRSPTIRNKIVRSYLPAPEKITWLGSLAENFRCGRCKHCDNMVRTNSFTDVSSGKIYPIKSFINCNSSYVVYRLECECGHFYVGQTKRKLRLRVAEHKYAIRVKNMLYPMARHYNEVGHVTESSLKVIGIESIPCSMRGGNRQKQLLQRETFWIHTLRATKSPGVNEETDFVPFL